MVKASRYIMSYNIYYFSFLSFVKRYFILLHDLFIMECKYIENSGIVNLLWLRAIVPLIPARAKEPEASPPERSRGEEGHRAGKTFRPLLTHQLYDIIIINDILFNHFELISKCGKAVSSKTEFKNLVRRTQRFVYYPTWIPTSPNYLIESFLSPTLTSECQVMIRNVHNHL